MILSTILCFFFQWLCEKFATIIVAIFAIVFIILLVAPDKYNDFWKW
jgi:hypothetical protein